MNLKQDELKKDAVPLRIASKTNDLIDWKSYTVEDNNNNNNNLLSLLFARAHYGYCLR